jgi:hypothetical protein
MNLTLVLGLMSFLCSAIGLFLCSEYRAPRIWRYVLYALAAAVCLMSPWMFADAQEVVHARTGKVMVVNPTSKTLVLKAADGEIVIFQAMAGHEPAMSFDKSIRGKTVPVAGYSKVGSNVVVFYYGYDTLTAVAIKELGADSLKKSTGSVSNFDRHDHSLTLKTEAPEPQKLVLNDDTIVDTSDGVVKLADYKPAKGAQLRCITQPESQVALLVAPQ